MTQDGIRVAYVVGINQYDDARIPPNRCAERDASRLRYTLEKAGFEVYLYSGDFTAATLARDVQALRPRFRSAETDCFLSFFACHAVVIKERGEEDQLMLLANVQLDVLQSGLGSATPATLSLRAWDAITRVLPARRLLLTDMCQEPLVSGTRGVAGPSLFSGDAVYRGLAAASSQINSFSPLTTINACSNKELAEELVHYPGGGRGALAATVDELLQEAAANDQPILAGEEWAHTVVQPRMDQLRRKYGNSPDRPQTISARGGSFPLYVPRRSSVGNRRRDEREWKLATLENTVEAYKTYLRNAHTDQHEDEAYDRIRQLLAQQQAATNAAEEQRREAQAWSKAEAADTPEAWAKFLSDYPASSQAEAARKRQQAAQEQLDAKCRAKEEEETRRKAEEAARMEEQNRKAEEAARKKKEQERAEEARRKAEAARAAEAAAWARAEAADTAEAWSNFVRDYPQSEKRAEAIQRQRTAQKRAEVANATSVDSPQAKPQPAAAPAAAPPPSRASNTNSSRSKWPWLAAAGVLSAAAVAGTLWLGADDANAPPQALTAVTEAANDAREEAAAADAEAQQQREREAIAQQEAEEAAKREEEARQAEQARQLAEAQAAREKAEREAEEARAAVARAEAEKAAADRRAAQLAQEKAALEAAQSTAAAPASAAAATSSRPSLPRVQNIHGWSASQVQALQKETASALGYANAQDVTIAGCGEICGHYVVVPPGQYTMGSPESEDGYSDERPQHPVTIAYPLLVGKYAVTFAQWDACVADGACKETPASAWGRGQQPVINVSWNEIRDQFLPWLNRKAGLSDKPRAEQFRLLSESEWEYMARAGTTGPFSFDGVISPAKVNYNSNYTYGGSRKDASGYRGRTVEVGSLPANPWGLHEVHGNVWEWVEDCWHGSYKGAPNNGSVWTSGCDGNRRVLRGGSWSGLPRSARSADRNNFTPGYRNYDAGFRVARMLPGA